MKEKLSLLLCSLFCTAGIVLFANYARTVQSYLPTANESYQIQKMSVEETSNSRD